MARLLSTSPAIPAPKTANVYIPIPTPQKYVETTSYARQTAPRDLGENTPLAGGELIGTGLAGVRAIAPDETVGVGVPEEPEETARRYHLNSDKDRKREK